MRRSTIGQDGLRKINQSKTHLIENKSTILSGTVFWQRPGDNLGPVLTCLTVAAALLPSDTSRSRTMASGWRQRCRPADPHPNHFVRPNTNKQARSFGWPGERDPDLSSAQGSR